MRIFAVADVHCKRNRLETIRRNIDRFAPDVLVAAGDITHLFGAVEFLERLNALTVPVLCVRGNTDLARVENRLDRLDNLFPLHLRRVLIGDVCFVGLTGTALLPFRSKIRYRENGIFNRLDPMLAPDTVLVTHPPPWGVRDRVFGRYHAGCRSLFRIVEKRQPALLICGHIHEEAGVGRIGKTVVVNCSMGKTGSGAIIDLEKGRPKKIAFPTR